MARARLLVFGAAGRIVARERMSFLRVTNLSKCYGTRRAVDGLELSADAGEIFGLLGPNGAGKTTTIEMIAGVARPSEGQVTLGGLCLWGSPRTARQLIGYVPQELALYEELTARENLRFFASPYGMGRSERGSRVEWALEVGGLAERADDPVEQFSGGMKRRLNLVCGLVHRPRLLILDEPTVGVDPQSRIFLFELVQRLRDELGMTVLYTSHYLEEVESLCSRVAILDRGRVLLCDTVDSLRARAARWVRIEFEGSPELVTSAVSDHSESLVQGQVLRVELSHCEEALSRLRESGVSLRSIRSEDSDLESVFLHLTGHALRDGAP